MMMAMMIWQRRTRSQLDESVAPAIRHLTPPSFAHVLCSNEQQQSVYGAVLASSNRRHQDNTVISTSTKPAHVSLHPPPSLSPEQYAPKHSDQKAIK
jgi:hypothetical protein